MKVFLWAARLQQFWQLVEKLSEKVSKNAQFPEHVKTTFFTKLSKFFSGQLECSFDKTRENFATPCDFFCCKIPETMAKHFVRKTLTQIFPPDS